MSKIVKLRVVEIPNATMNIRSSRKETPKILPGVSHTLAPVLDSFGRIKTGTTKEEYESIMKEEMGDLIPYQEFYRNFSIKVTDQGRDFDVTIPKHKLMVLLLKTLPEVAENKEKINPVVHNFYLVDEDAEAVKKLSAIQYKKKAYSYFSDMSPKDVRDFLVLYGKNSDTSSDDVVQAKLGELIESNPEKFIKMFEDINKELKINVRKMIDKGVLRKEGKAIFYGDEGEAIFLGATEELAIEKLKDFENQELYISLLEQIRK